MIEVVCVLLIVIAMVSAYLVSLYSLAVYIDPDEVETLFPRLSPSRREFLRRLARNPRDLRRVAASFKSFVLMLVCLCLVILVLRLGPALKVNVPLLTAMGMVLAWLLHVYLVEQLPRRRARRAINERMLRHLWLMRVIYTTFLPILTIYRKCSHEPRQTEVTEEDKEDLVERAIETLAEEAGIDQAIIEDEEKEMIGQIFHLDQTVAREIMIPRMDIAGIERSLSFREIRQLVNRDGRSRYPVYDRSIDKIIGVLYVKDLFNRMPEPGEVFRIEKYLRRPYLVPETKVIGELLKEFKVRHQHIAIVVDEYGGVAGLVTLEDIIEEIFGEIQDEHDTEPAQSQVLPDGRLQVSAAMSVEELQEMLGTEYDQSDNDTVGGLIYDLVGSVPRQGQRVKWHEVEFEVVSVKGQRIMAVAVQK